MMRRCDPTTTLVRTWAVFVVCMSFVCSLVVRDYNEVRYLDNVTWPTLIRDYFNFNGEERANTNVFLGVYGDDACRQDVASPQFLAIQRHAGGHTVLPVLMKASEISQDLREGILSLRDQCGAVFFYRFGDSIGAPTDFTSELDYSSFNAWSVEKTRVQIEFVNKFSFPVEMFWHEELGDTPLSQGFMRAGEKLVVSSMLGHVFSIRRSARMHRPQNEEPGQLVDYFVVHELQYTMAPINRLETCEMDPSHWQAVFVDPEQLTCENMETRFVEFSQHVWHITRLGLNYLQPQLVRAASVAPLGFELRKMPEDTFRWLQGWYNTQRQLQEEAESTSGPCMNQRVAPSKVTHIDPAGKGVLERAMKPILREWNGGGEVQLTSIYGVRRYTNGSVLRMHVDTASTHVVSAIINVDQKVDTDWPVLILDHDYNEHRVNMVPGDMLLYESAKLLHGRPDVFVGEYYDNIFVHFQPVSGWDYDWIYHRA